MVSGVPEAAIGAVTFRTSTRCNFIIIWASEIAVLAQVRNGGRSEFGLDFGPMLKSNKILVRLEADAFANEVDTALCKVFEDTLHRDHRVHQRRDAIDDDPIAHLSEDLRRKQRRPAAFQHIGQQGYVERASDPKKVPLHPQAIR